MYLIKNVRTYFNEYVYIPLNILEAMDTGGGKCNLQVLMLLHDIELNINHPYKDCFKKGESILPHKWRLRAVSKIIHEYAGKIVPIQHYIGRNCEVVEY